MVSFSLFPSSIIRRISLFRTEESELEVAPLLFSRDISALSPSTDVGACCKGRYCTI